MRNSVAASEPKSAFSAKTGLDSIDERILDVLQRDARVLNTALAAQVGLSPSPCLRRVRRLERDGFISGYGARIDRRRTGFEITAFLSIDIERNRKLDTDVLRERIRALPEVIAAHIVSGEGDFLLEIVAPDLAAYSTFVLNVVNQLPGIKGLRSSIALEAVQPWAPLPLGPAETPRTARSRNPRRRV